MMTVFASPGRFALSIVEGMSIVHTLGVTSPACGVVHCRGMPERSDVQSQCRIVLLQV